MHASIIHSANLFMKLIEISTDDHNTDTTGKAIYLQHYSNHMHVIYFMNLSLVGRSTEGCNNDSQTIGIAVLVVLLVVAIACIVGLIVWNVKLNKKLAQAKSKEK